MSGALADAGGAACGGSDDPFACGAERLYGWYFSRLAAVPTPGRGPLAPTHPPPDVVLIVADGLRADLLDTGVMPRLRRWSDRGARFASHRATANRSDWGMFALVYGRPPLHYTATIRARVPPALPSLLKRTGYATHYLCGTAQMRWLMVGRFLARPYFDEVFQPPADGEAWERDRAAIERAQEILAAAGGPRLLVIWLVSTHFPYSAPQSYGALEFPDDPGAVAPDQLDLRRNARPDYLRSARFLDDALGDWLQRIDLTRTLVAVTADHGESLYEDGTFSHGSRLSSAQTRVPLVVAGPGVPAGDVVTRPTGHLDLAPTLLALAGVPAATVAALPGRVLTGPDAAAPAYAAAYQPIRETYTTLRDVVLAGEGDGPLQLLLASDALRVGLDLDPQQARVSGVTRLDDAGLPSATPLTRAEVGTALGWLDDHFARSAGDQPAPP